MELILRFALFISALLGLIIGIISIKKNKSPLFDKIVACAIGCMAIGRVYDLVLYCVDGSIPYGLNLGDFGILGGFLFTFSASFGQMDGLIDDHLPKYKRYRFIPLLAPAVLVVLYIFYFRCETLLFHLIVRSITFIIMGLAAYFNLKHLIFPEDELGIVKTIKNYNVLSLLLIFTNALQFIADSLSSEIMWVVCSVLICILYIIICPILQGGTKKWVL